MVRYAHPGKPCDLIDASSVSTAGSSVPGNSEADRGLFTCVPRYRAERMSLSAEPAVGLNSMPLPFNIGP